MKNFPIIDALITNTIVMCEIDENGGKPVLAYGLEIAEYNLTNRLNVLLVVILRYQSILKKELWSLIQIGITI